MDFRTDVVIVGTGVAGTFSALNLPKDKNIIMITKSDLESSDSFLAQGGICVLTDENDYDNYFEDTMKAGHYENRKESVDIMIRSSQLMTCDFAGPRAVVCVRGCVQWVLRGCRRAGVPV